MVMRGGGGKEGQRKTRTPETSGILCPGCGAGHTQGKG